MSHRKSFGAAYHGGGDLYSYVDGDTYTRSNDSAVYDEDEKSPDMIYVRYQNESWPFAFPAFSIAEEQVLVKHIRELVADKLNISDRRVRLIYKERVLRRNKHPLRDYGCKQNSEISARITLEPRDYDNYRGDSESDSGSAISRHKASDDDRHHSRRHRHHSHSRPNHDEPRTAHQLSNSSNGMLHPHQPPPPIRETREPREHQPRPTHLSDSRPDSPNYASSGGRHSPKSNGPSPRTSAQSVNISTPTADPNTPLGKVQGMRHELHTKWMPEVESFLKAPPADTDERTKEYRRLSEILFKRVWEVGDMVDPSADEKNKEEIRALRKQSYAEAQALVNQLDVHKG